MRILVVEDDHKLGSLLEQGLREEGFEPHWVRNGEEGLNRALSAPYDLLLLDYMLPGKDGRQVASELRAAGRHLPILMLTARDAADDFRLALEAGVTHLMGKPFRFAELVARIRELTAASLPS